MLNLQNCEAQSCGNAWLAKKMGYDVDVEAGLLLEIGHTTSTAGHRFVDINEHVALRRITGLARMDDQTAYLRPTTSREDLIGLAPFRQRPCIKSWLDTGPKPYGILLEGIVPSQPPCGDKEMFPTTEVS